MKQVERIVDRLTVPNLEYTRGESWDADKMLFMEDKNE